MAKGVAYLTEDRKNEGLALRLLVDDNILSSIIPRLSVRTVFRKRRGAHIVKRQMDALSVYPPNTSRTAAPR